MKTQNKFWIFLAFVFMQGTSAPANEVQEVCGKIQKIEAMLMSTRFTLKEDLTGIDTLFGMNQMDDAKALVVAAFVNELTVCVRKVGPKPEGQIDQAVGIRLTK